MRIISLISIKRISQTSYLFTYKGIAISWRYVKQILMASSSIQLKIITIHKVSQEYMWLKSRCTWLKSIIQHIKIKYGLAIIDDSPIILFEYNVIYITQLRGNYIKGDKIMHISPEFFYTHKLQLKRKFDIKQIKSNDNLADLPTSTFKKLVQNIRIHHFKDLS